MAALSRSNFKIWKIQLRISDWQDMGSKWRKAKLALGRQMCLSVPDSLEQRQQQDSTSSANATQPRLSDALLPSSVSQPPSTPSASSSALRLSRSSKVNFINIFYIIMLFLSLFFAGFFRFPRTDLLYFYSISTS